MKRAQLSFAQAENSKETDFNHYWSNTKRKFHSGIQAKGKRKTRRPLDTKKPIHPVMSSEKAKGPLSFTSPLNKNKVDSIVHEYAARSACL